MNKRSIDEILTGTSPAFAPSIATEAALDELVLETRSAGHGGRKSRRRSALWLVPGAILAVGALTGGAVVVDQLTRLDVPIPIEYTTDTGVTVSCTAHISSTLFSPRMGEVARYYKEHEFAADGIGQRIYNYALVLSGDKIGTRADLPSSVEWLPGDENDGGWEPQSGRSALTESMLDFIVIDVENERGWTSGSGTRANQITSDCTGQLH